MSNGWKIAIVAMVIVAVVVVLAGKSSDTPATPDAAQQFDAPVDDGAVQGPKMPPSPDEAPPEAKGGEETPETPQPSADEADAPAASQPEKQASQAATANGDEVDRVIDGIVVNSERDAASTQQQKNAAADETDIIPEQGQKGDENADKQLPRFVEVGAESCVPCKMMQPVLDELRSEYKGQLEVVMADVWKNPELGKEYGVRSIPTQVIYDSSGEEVFRHMGYWPKDDIDAKLKELGIVD